MDPLTANHTSTLLPTYSFQLTSPITLATVLLALALALFLRQSNSRKGPLPPGPKGWPLIGNMLDLPKSRPWVQMEKWTREYGEWGFKSRLRVASASRESPLGLR